MADEPDDIEPDLLRERLLVLAKHGEITGAQAEAIAAAHGLEPFARKPELPRFDPKRKSHWSILMAVAWIARRDFELVRNQDPELCSAWFYWVGLEREVSLQPGGETVKRMVYLLTARGAPTVGRLTVVDDVLRGAPDVSSKVAMWIPEAVAALWQALSEGRLIAVGFDAHNAVVEIPSREWVYLRLREKGGRDVLSYDGVSQPEPFTAVTLRQSDVLRLWPVAGESPALLATVIDKGAGPAGYDGGAVKGSRPDEPVGIATKAHGPWQIDRINQALAMEFPDGVPPDVTGKEIQRRIEPFFKRNSWKLPSVDSIARARGRRKVG